jgi:hypothetical protein
MKILSNSDIETLQQGQAASSKETEAKKPFSDYLFEEAAKTGTPAMEGQGSAPRIMADPFLQIEGLEQAEAVQSSAAVDGLTEDKIASHVDDVLSKWEEYAEQLDSNGDLREAYGALQDITEDVERLKSATSSVGVGAGLQSMVDEIEVMAATEQFKFNRGDYV